MLFIVLFAEAYAPSVSDVAVGNTNELQLLAVAAFVVSMMRGRSFVAGLILAVGVLIKPNLVWIAGVSFTLLAVDHGWDRLWRLFGGLLTGTVLAVAIGSVYFGRPGVWVDFMTSIPATLSFSHPLEAGNFGLTSLIFYYAGVRTGLLCLGVLVAAFIAVLMTAPRLSAAAAASLSSTGEGRLNEACRAVGLGSSMMVLSSNLVWLHYYVLLIPVWIYQLRPRNADDSSGGIAAPLGVLSTIPLFLLTSMVGAVVTANGPYSVLVNVGGLMAVCLMMYDVRTSRRFVPMTVPGRRARRP
jgi:hypothetical protein